MSKPVGPNLRRFLEETMTRYGISILGASTYPGAREAELEDEKDALAKDGAKSTREWLQNYDGKGFQSKEDRMEAFADPAYKTSESYRQAVARMVADSSDEVMGLKSTTLKGTTNEEMLKQARHEAYDEKRAELMGKAARGSAADRLALMEWHNDPANAEYLAEYERTERELKPLETYLKEAKGRGERVGTPLSEEKPTDPAQGEAQATGQHASGFVVTPWPS